MAVLVERIHLKYGIVVSRTYGRGGGKITPAGGIFDENPPSREKYRLNSSKKKLTRHSAPVVPGSGRLIFM